VVKTCNEEKWRAVLWVYLHLCGWFIDYFGKDQWDHQDVSDSYRLKNDSVSKPTLYLGAEIKVFRDPDCPSVEMWSMSANKYLKEAIRNVERDLEWLGYKLPPKVNTPPSHKYRPELDITAFLDDNYTRWFQKLIGILWWSVELGHIDIHLPVALLAQYLAQPWSGHLLQEFHIFGYLKVHDQSKIVFDPKLPKVDEASFEKQDWMDFYGNVNEIIPPNAPPPRGKSFVISCFVDADHAGNLVTRCSHTGILIFCNWTLRDFYS
jgi:hypothetical protein